VEEEEIDDGHHNLDYGDEGRSENRALLLDAPGHYQIAHAGRHDSLHQSHACCVFQMISKVDITIIIPYKT
jgi:hypothetical protein